MTATDPPPRDAPVVLRGTGVVPGLAHAPAVWARARPTTLPAAVELPAVARAAEVARLEEAVAVIAERLDRRASASSGVSSEVLSTTAALVRDRAWGSAAAEAIRDGSPAPHATVAAIARFVDAFERLGGVMAERTADLADVRDRVVAQLLGLPEPGIPQPEAPVVLLADDLAPADTAGLDPERVVGLATRLGGPTSHTAIIARQLGIPCVVAVAELGSVAEGERLLLEGIAGIITVDPPPAQALARMAHDERRRDLVRAWRGPGRTADGAPVELLANVQDGASARVAARGQAAGVGLLRTELAFFHVEREPSVAVQARVYGEVLDAFGAARVVIRTLDAGSDKPLAFARTGSEENPALGVRGIRLARHVEGLLTRQLDAIALAADRRPARPRPWVMAPMVATIEEARAFAARCRERELSPGVMVEVPAVAVLADRIAAHVDFLSVGTNDLAQYTMAADRMNPHLASHTDAWQPAVLALVAASIAGGRARGLPVGVCGEAAADPLLACVLVGMGADSLSMAAPALPWVGAQLAGTSRERCAAAAAAALAAQDARGARDAARALLL